MKAEGDIGVILCRCRGRLAQRFDLGALKNYLSEIEGVAYVDVEDDLCRDPDPLKRRRSKGLVIAGCSTRKHIDFFKDILERTKIPFFLCEFVDLLGALDPDPASSEKNTELTRLIIKAHIEKMQAAFEMALSVKPTGVKEVMGAGKEKVTRRGFLRLPLMAAKIISHYEEIPLFDEKRCIAAQSPCRECIRRCPFEALEIRNGKIHVLEDKCEKCGLCATLCPVDAVQMSAFSALQALRLVDALADCNFSVDHRSLILTCDKGREKMSEDPAKFRHSPLNPITVRVPCVASISSVFFLRCLELGFDTVIPLCPDAACPKRQAVEAWKERIDALLRMVGTLGIPPRLVFVTLHRGEAEPVLSRIHDDVLSEQGPTHLTRDPTSLSFHSRADMVRILGTLTLDKDLLNTSINGAPFPFFDIRIDQEKCSLCGACARHCPAEALRIDQGSEPRINYSTFNCAGCKKCVDICPEGAVSIRRVMNLSKLKKDLLVTKASDESARCRNCGQVIGKRRLLEEVEKKLKKSGFEVLAERMHYCQACKNTAARQGDEIQAARHEGLH